MKKISMLVLLILNIACTLKENKKEIEALQKEAQGVFVPLSDVSKIIDLEKNKNLIALGEKLYFEKKLSFNDTISCNSCHKLDQFGVDNEATSLGHSGLRGDRNSPTVYNSAIHFVQFWDGRAQDLAEQAIGPILNPIEHGLKNEKEALKKIAIPEYMELFRQAFNDKKAFTYKNIGVAIAAFEKTLLTPSRFDDFLKGDAKALNAQERQGLKTFMDKGCISCHSGEGVGGNSFQKIGMINSYPTKDEGRFKITKNEEDKFFFKVPSLRNVVHTAPYFHDGSVQTLEAAIRIMGYHQLDLKLTDAEIADIKVFLGSLSGKEGTFYSKK
ncbi:MAG: cytochrome-c peroxidase [Bacteriovoracaceae bacterium]|nr:cytochrome-c peroxidase [Bacteriovoracaceae bacterium]